MIDASKVKGVVFDAFGTLVHLGVKTNPYRSLFRLAAQQGIAGASEMPARAMMANKGILDLAKELGIELSSAQSSDLLKGLIAETYSACRFPESLEVIKILREDGFKVGLCSNLAQPYGQCLSTLLPEFDFKALSYELGLIKPMPEIYSAVCSGMDLEPSAILFVGDSKPCDYLGPTLAGMQAIHLQRGQNGGSIDRLTGVLSLLNII